MPPRPVIPPVGPGRKGAEKSLCISGSRGKMRNRVDMMLVGDREVTARAVRRGS